MNLCEMGSSLRFTFVKP